MPSGGVTPSGGGGGIPQGGPLTAALITNGYHVESATQAVGYGSNVVSTDYEAYLRAGNGPAATQGNFAGLVGGTGDAGNGGTGASVVARGGAGAGGVGGPVIIRTLDSQGDAGQALCGDSSGRTQWNTLGAIKCDTHAAPADGALAAGDLYLWFDQTNGAAKLMVKAKQANGTVVAASVALS